MRGIAPGCAVFASVMASVAVPRWITPLTGADRSTSTVSPSSAVASARIVMGISADVWPVAGSYVMVPVAGV